MDTTASSERIDQIVKGAPPPDVSAEQLAASAKFTTNTASGSSNPPTVPTPHSVTAPIPPSQLSGSHNDPRDALPSSPPQIYLNLLILESSLRLQYLTLRARLRLHALLLAFLTAWVVLFTYLLFFRPREDGSGVGGSVYWVLESAEKLGWCSGIVTLALFWGTGMYERGVRWPRKFISTTNRGLRGFNLKVVIVRSSFLGDLGRLLLDIIDVPGWLREDPINFQTVPRDIEGGVFREQWNAHAAKHGVLEEDLARGGDVLMVLMLPKPFSPDFREGWDTYRTEFWEKENARRATLRTIVRSRQRQVARRDGGWLWWTGWRGWRNLSLLTARKTRRQLELERLALKEPLGAGVQPASAAISSLNSRRRKDGLHSASHSRNSSRSSTPDPDAAFPPLSSTSTQRRRASSSHSASSVGSRRPRRPGSSHAHEKSRLSATETILSDGSSSFADHAPKRASTLLSMSAVNPDDLRSGGSADSGSGPVAKDSLPPRRTRSRQVSATTAQDRDAVRPLFAETIQAEPPEA